MFNQKIVTHSYSPCSAPFWVVRKKLEASGNIKWRVLVDYERLHETTIYYKHLQINITNSLDKFRKCQYFTKLGIPSGFQQREMNESDIKTTAFSTEHGEYEFLRIASELTYAPATFQHARERFKKRKCLSIQMIFQFSLYISMNIQNNLKVFRAFTRS